ncbi:hypothetical protein FCJ61_22470 [Burkholderia metallica]|nr:hypothetical protein [Burkholderia metallica]
MGDRLGLTRRGGVASRRYAAPFFCLQCLPAIWSDSIWPRHMAMCMRCLTSIFFRTLPTFIDELLLIYFFVIWLDRHARRRAARWRRA